MAAESGDHQVALQAPLSSDSSKVDDHGEAGSGWRSTGLHPRRYPLQIDSKVYDDCVRSGWRTPKFHPYKSRPQIEPNVAHDSTVAGCHTLGLHPRRSRPQMDIHGRHWWDRRVLPELVGEEIVKEPVVTQDEQALVDSDAETDDGSANDLVQKECPDAMTADSMTADENDEGLKYHLTLMQHSFDEIDEIMHDMGEALRRAKAIGREPNKD